MAVARLGIGRTSAKMMSWGSVVLYTEYWRVLRYWTKILGKVISNAVDQDSGFTGFTVVAVLNFRQSGFVSARK